MILWSSVSARLIIQGKTHMFIYTIFCPNSINSLADTNEKLTNHQKSKYICLHAFKDNKRHKKNIFIYE